MKLGFYPLPKSEAQKLESHLAFPVEPFAALDPCVGDGVALTTILGATSVLRYGIELDSSRADQARQHGIEVLQGNALETRCRVDSLALVYLNPPYDFEVGKIDNQRTGDRLPASYKTMGHAGRGAHLHSAQRQLGGCARTLAEHFENMRVYRLTGPESVKYNQVAVLAVRRKRQNRLRDEALESHSRQLEQSSQMELPHLPDRADIPYSIPPSAPATLVYHGLPLDEIEDRLIEAEMLKAQQAKKEVV